MLLVSTNQQQQENQLGLWKRVFFHPLSFFGYAAVIKFFAYWLLECGVRVRLDLHPLFGKRARAPSPNSSQGGTKTERELTNWRQFHEFRHNIVKVAVDPRGDSRVDPQSTFTVLWRNSLSITGQKHEKLTSIFFTIKIVKLSVFTCWRIAKIINSCVCPLIDDKISHWTCKNLCCYSKIIYYSLKLAVQKCIIKQSYAKIQQKISKAWK